MRAAQQFNAASVLVSGGVAANSQLRTTFEQRGQSAGIATYFPSRALSTDNAAMIAAAAFSQFQAHHLAGPTLNANPNLKLA